MAEGNVLNISREVENESGKSYILCKKVNKTLSASEEAIPEGYDSEGAMKFVVATILVYSLLCVLSIVLTRTRICRRKRHQHMDEGLRNYLRNAKRFRTEAHHQKLKARCAIMQKKVELYEEHERRTIETAAKSFPFYLYEGVKDFKRVESSPANLKDLDICPDDLEEQNPRKQKSIAEQIKKHSTFFNKYGGKQRRKSNFALPTFTSNKRRTTSADLKLLALATDYTRKRRASGSDMSSDSTSMAAHGSHLRLNNSDVPSNFASKKVSFYVDADGADMV